MSLAHEIGPFDIVGTIGAGGMGQVYEGIHRDTGQRCAVKMVHPDGGLGVQAIKALRREVQVLADLDHPHIVKVIDFDLGSDQPWFAMEYIEGRPLSDWNAETAGGEISTADTIVDIAAKTNLGNWESLQFALTQARRDLEVGSNKPVRSISPDERRIDWQPSPELRSKLSWIGQISRALQFLHGLNIIHGDVKPENVLIRTDGTAVLVDFGLVSRKGRRVTHTALDRSLTRAQTFEYAAPERFLKADYDARADLYGIGCMLFESFAGVPPFTGPPSAVAIAHAVQEPPQLDDVAEPPPPALAALIDSLLRKDPLQRTAYLNEVCALLEDYSIPTTAAGRPTPAARPFLYQPGFVGFDAEMTEARTVVRAVNSQEAAPVLQVIGPAGSGKSRFLLEVAASAVQSNAHVLLISSDDPGDERTPFASMRFVLDHLLDRCVSGEWRPTEESVWIARLDPRLRRFMQPPDLDLLEDLEQVSPKAGARATSRAFANAIREIAADKLAVLLVEALDELETGSRAVVEAVLKRSNTEPWLIVATTMAVLELDGHESHPVELTPFDDESIAMFVAQMLGGAELDQETVDLLRLETKGRPAPLQAFVHVLLDNELIEQDDRGRWRGANGEPLSTAAKKLIRTEATRPDRRIARLSPDARRVAEVCAILGRAHNLNDVLTIEGVRAGAALTAVSQLIGSKLLAEGQFGDRDNLRDLVFVSREVRRVLHDEMDPERRRALHLAAAEIMEERDDLASLAEHLEGAGEAEQAAAAWLAAAKRAQANYSQKLHIRCIEGALRTSPALTSDERESLLYRRLNSISDVASTEVFEAESVSLLDVARHPATRAKVLFVYVGRMLQEARANEVQHYIEELGDLAVSKDPSAAVPANTILRTWHSHHGRTEDALAAGQRAFEAAEGIGNVELELQANVALGNALFWADRLEECLELGEQAVALAKRTGEAHKIHTAIGRMVAIRAKLGHFSQVRTAIAPIAQVQRKTRQTSAYLISLYNLAYADHVVGRFAEALETCELMESFSAEAGINRDEGEYLTRKAASLAVLGRQAQALSHVVHAADVARAPRVQRHAEFEACHVLRLQGKIDAALERLNHSDKTWPGLEQRRHLLIAQCALDTGDVALAKDELGRVEPDSLAPHEQAYLDFELGRLELARGRRVAARLRLETALAWFDDHEFAYDSAMARIELATAFDDFGADDEEHLSSVRSYIDSQPFEATAPIRVAFARLIASKSQ